MSDAVFGRGRLDLPLRLGAAGPLLCLTIALIGYFATICGFALILLGDDVREWNRSLANGLTLQIPVDASAARLDMVLALLRQTAGIRELHLLDPVEAARLLEPWLGPAAATNTLPVPRLIDVQTDPGTAIDFTDLRTKLSVIVPGAQLDDHQQWLAVAHGVAVRGETLAAIAIAVLAALAVALAVLTTRAGLALRGDKIELLHRLGAEDADIARPFHADALRFGLLGGGIGAAAALFTGAVAIRLMPSAAATAAMGLTNWRLWSVAIAVALAVGAIAMLAARATVLRWLAPMP